MTRVLIPRDGSWGERVSELVVDAGFEPLVLPLIRVAPADDQDALRERLDELGAGRYDWLVVTSQSTVRYLPRVPAAVSVAAVGNVTAAALRERGIPVAFVPRTQSAAGLVDEWPIPTGRVLWPRSLDAKPTIKDGLTAKGMEVVDVVAYRTVSVLDAEEHELDDLGVLAGDDQALTAFEPRETPVDAVLVTSGSVAKQVLRLGLPAGTTIVAIGEQTAEDCRRAGLHVSAIASRPTPEGLVEALVAARR
ncbi:uroporphyrinogen-III synthase [Agrococcus sp. SGAir0287]|uniref:uroporphyrinogen-III synthase n=1 Tax=Agrococcus sp. SGAir0287 TaxID=2070347 RepID=UPI0010CD620E|nr:uroporphyrinogen-III synthase [Agrococcus sp. SGAir0287]QCR18111.1 uroporphyrinogen III synthase [Agrococcus sp. SGAir0287]